MSTASQLKAQLAEIAAADYKLPPEEELPGLLQAMLDCIGSPDSQLRDDLIYGTFAVWISGDALPVDTLRMLCITVVDDHHLFYRLGERHSDSVFTRSFSILLLPLILTAHRRSPFFEAAELKALKTKVLDYAYREEDRRGYVDKGGWAHAVAHCADTLDDLARCQELGATDLREILAAIQYLITAPQEVYGHAEDERLSVATAGILERQLLPLSDWQSWLKGCTDAVENANLPFPQKLYLGINVKNFLRCFYFRAGRDSRDDLDSRLFASLIEEAQARLVRF